MAQHPGHMKPPPATWERVVADFICSDLTESETLERLTRLCSLRLVSGPRMPALLGETALRYLDKAATAHQLLKVAVEVMDPNRCASLTGTGAREAARSFGARVRHERRRAAELAKPAPKPKGAKIPSHSPKDLA